MKDNLNMDIEEQISVKASVKSENNQDDMTFSVPMIETKLKWASDMTRATQVFFLSSIS